jgi:1-propanol dehydrogenase
VEQFSCKTKIISGPGASDALGTLGIRRLLLVTDPFFMKCGTAQRLAVLSGAEHYEIFHRIEPDPTVALAAEGTALVQQLQPDTIVALGGGSAMDCAKAMAYFSGLALQLVAIPTTSGSGSEVTDFAILTHDRVKHPLVDERLRPDVAILDSDLLKELPKSLVAAAGFDVLSHAVEAYVATGAGPITDALAQDAFGAAFHALPDSYAGRLHVRQRIHVAATMAGMAFTQAGLGLCHALAHSLGGVFHLPHGQLNAILLPAVIDCNARVCGEKYARLARTAQLGGTADTMAVRNLKNALIRLRRELQLPQTLAQAGVDPRQVRHGAGDIVAAALADPCCATNPRKLDEATVRAVLEEVTGGV